MEARTPIDATHTPGDANTEFVLAQAGSYYLTGNLNVTKTNGIRITTAGVTVDLNGFQIARISGGGHGIELLAANNCTIKNGSITGFVGNGVSDVALGSTVGGAISQVTVSNCSIGIVAGDGWRIDSCNVHDNTGDGIQTGFGCTITSCRALSNGGYGIFVDRSCTLRDCTAVGNQGQYGIHAGDGCTLIHCTARSNTSANSSSGGISAGNGCAITACTATLNGSTNATLTGATGAGIAAGSYSQVQNCVAIYNKGDGIIANTDCMVIGNACSNNGFSTGDGAGIHVLSGNHTRVEGNNVINNDRGIDIDSAGNLIIKNSASGNTPNYDIVASNFVGTTVTTEAAMNSATNSNINISY